MANIKIKRIFPFQPNPNLGHFRGDNTLARLGDLNELIKRIEPFLGPGNGDDGDPSNHIISGGIVTWISDYNYNISPTTYKINGIIYHSPSTDVTLEPADDTLDRVDTFIVDTFGNAGVLTGTPDVSPASPSIDVNTQLALGIATVGAGTTSATVAIEYIYRENTEWTTASSNSSTLDPDSVSNPLVGSKSILANGAQNLTTLTFTTGASFDSSIYNVLSFTIRSNVAWAINQGISFVLMNAGNPVSSPVLLSDNTYGFRSTAFITEQIISIPLADLDIVDNIDAMKFTIISPSGDMTFWMDEVNLQQAIISENGGTAASPSYWDGVGSHIKNNNAGSVGVGMTPSGFYKLEVSQDAVINGVRIGQGGPLANSNPQNTAVGNSALRLGTGGACTAMGVNALGAMTTGIQNSAFGSGACQNLQTGQYNTGIGAIALSANFSGSQNTAIGWGAQFEAVNPANNTLVGWYAGRKLAGSFNTGIGHGVYGPNSISPAITGSNNTLLGAQATLTATNTSGAIGLGYLANPSTNQMAISPLVIAIKIPGMTTGVGWVLTDVLGDGVFKAAAPSGGGGGGSVNSVQSGNLISIDATDPANPIANYTGPETFDDILTNQNVATVLPIELMNDTGSISVYDTAVQKIASLVVGPTSGQLDLVSLSGLRMSLSANNIGTIDKHYEMPDAADGATLVATVLGVAADTLGEVTLPIESVSSGPTLGTGTSTNLDEGVSTFNNLHFMKVFNIVTCSGTALISPLAAGTFTLKIPVIYPGVFGATDAASGTAVAEVPNTLTDMFINANGGSGSLVMLTGESAGTTTSNVHFTFQYTTV